MADSNLEWRYTQSPTNVLLFDTTRRRQAIPAVRSARRSTTFSSAWANMRHVSPPSRDSGYVQSAPCVHCVPRHDSSGVTPPTDPPPHNYLVLAAHTCCCFSTPPRRLLQKFDPTCLKTHMYDRAPVFYQGPKPFQLTAALADVNGRLVHRFRSCRRPCYPSELHSQ